MAGISVCARNWRNYPLIFSIHPTVPLPDEFAGDVGEAADLLEQKGRYYKLYTGQYEIA